MRSELPPGVDIDPAYDRNLSLIQTLYVVVLAFGMERATEALFAFMHGKSAEGIDALFVGLSSVVLLSFIVRLFWSVGNIREYIEARVKDGIKPNDFSIVLFHFPILLLQGVIMQFVCHGFADYVQNARNQGAVLAYFWGVLALNGAWLALIGVRLKEKRVERVWAKNNLAISLIAFLFWLGYSKTEHFAITMMTLFGLNSIIDLWVSAPAYIRKRILE